VKSGSSGDATGLSAFKKIYPESTCVMIGGSGIPHPAGRFFHRKPSLFFPSIGRRLSCKKAQKAQEFQTLERMSADVPKLGKIPRENNGHLFVNLCADMFF